MKLSRLFAALIFMVAILSAGCSTEDNAGNESDQPTPLVPTITLMTHDSFSLSKPVLKAFEDQVRAKLVILKSGDAGEALNKAILSKNNPMADIFYGVDNTFFGRALAEDIFVPYTPKGLEDVDAALKLDPEHRLVPVDFGDVCLNWDIKWFEQKAIAPPQSLEDLIKPEYKDLTVVQNPATSSPGLAFLLATVSRFGEPGYLKFWQDLKNNGLMITSGWKEAYWGEFSAASEGSRPIVVSYASSPAAEVFYAKDKPEKAPTGVVLENGSAFRQVEFAGILKGTKHLDTAQKAMDFILSTTFQQDIPLQMFVFPANSQTRLPDVFVKHARAAQAPAMVPAGELDVKREIWIREWTENILQ